MRNAQLAAGGALLALAAFLFAQGQLLSYYTPLGPGPGFFPYWLSGLLAVLALGIMLRAILGPPEAPPNEPPLTPRAAWRGAVAIATIGAVALLIDPLGFRLTMLCMLATLLPTLGYRRPLGVAAIAVAGGFGTAELFQRVLATPLPVGLLGI